MKLLSILIPSLSVREVQLNRVLYMLDCQIAKCGLSDKIEVITFVDNFKNSIGKKRNILLDEASSKFTCFIDDDDILGDNYCHSIITAIESNSNIQHVGFKVRVFINGKEKKNAYHSLKYNGWYKNRSGYYRQTTTLNPILSSISKSVKFQEINYQEDSAWVNDIIKTGFLKDEVFIDDFLYLYYFNSRTSLSGGCKDININNQVIDWSMKDIKNLKIKEINI